MDVTVLNRQRARRINAAGLANFLARAVAETPPQREGSLVLCLVSDRKMRDYNARFRGRDTPTDVLCFPGDGQADPGGEFHLGDIVISVESAARQARERRHSLPREMRILALHGYLHLLGLDHESDAGEMLRLQRRLVRKLLPRHRNRSAN